MKKNKAEKIGPTGRFPHGKLDSTDDGELCVAVNHWVVVKKDGSRIPMVKIDLGTPVTWIAMTADEARNFAKTVIEVADESDAMLTGVKPTNKAS